MSVDKTYKCEYCGKVYSDPLSAARCTIKCAEEKEKAEKLEQEAKEKANLEKLEKEINEAYKQLESLIYEYNHLSKEKKYDCTLSKTFEKTRNFNSYSPKEESSKESVWSSYKNKDDTIRGLKDSIANLSSEIFKEKESNDKKKIDNVKKSIPKNNFNFILDDVGRDNGLTDIIDEFLNELF